MSSRISAASSPSAASIHDTIYELYIDYSIQAALAG